MRSKLLIDVALMVLVCFLAGCGVEDKKEQRKESVASESADKKREECKEEFFNGMSGDVLTKNCIYTTKGDAEDEENEDEFCIVQKNRRGEEQNRFGVKSDKEYGSYLVAGSDKRLILSGTLTNKDFTAKRVYWQVPIRQTKDGEILLWEERKEVVSGEPLDCDKPDDVYVVEPYMLFHDGKNIVRINLETGERRQLAWEEDLSEATLSYFGQDADAVYMTNYPLAAEGQADAGHNRGILYRIDIETWEAEEVYAGAEEYSLCKLWKADGTHMYLNYTTKEDSDVWQLSFVECYDRKRKQSIGRCTRQDIERLLDKEHIYGDEKKWGKL